MLPVLGIRDPADAIAFINRRDRPLALYWFGRDREPRRSAGAHGLRRRQHQRLSVSLRANQPADRRRRRIRHRRLSRRIGFSHLQQAEAGLLSLQIQPPRRSLSALWRQDRAAGEDDAVHVVAIRHCERSEAIQSLYRSGSLDCFAALAMTTRKNVRGETSVIDAFDFIVVGAGSGGCAVAGRLSEDAATSVALLDAGGTQRRVGGSPRRSGSLCHTRRGGNWAFDTVPQKGLNGRIGYRPRGKGLGGSSAINAMVYIRGHKWGLRPLGLARQCRLVVCGCAALFQAFGEQFRFRR